MSLAFLAMLAGLGFGGAFVSGLVGIGGAIVMIPLLLYVPPPFGMGSLDIKLVAGITMAQVLMASLIGAWTHGRGALVDRRLAVTGGTGIALGSLIGSVGSRYVGERVLLVVFALAATVALPLMFVSPAPPADGSVRFNRGAAFAYPGIIGLMAGFIGAGGGFLLFPVLTGLMRVPVRVSIGTSLAITVVSALMGFLGKALTAQIPLWPTVAVLAGSLPGAGLGARLSGATPVPVLRGVLATLIALATLRVWADVLFH